MQCIAPALLPRAITVGDLPEQRSHRCIGQRGREAPSSSEDPATEHDDEEGAANPTWGKTQDHCGQQQCRAADNPIGHGDCVAAEHGGGVPKEWEGEHSHTLN